MPRKQPPIELCRGCGNSFVPDHVRQVYHSVTCRKNAQTKRRTEIRRDEADRIAIASYNSYAEKMRKLRPKGAIGYQLYCRELNVFLPISSSLRRNGENPRTRYFALQPLELPVSPLVGEYGIYWVFADGSAKMSDPPTSIRLEWADDCRHRKLLGGLLKDYRRARKEQAEREWLAYEATHGGGVLQAKETHRPGLLLEPLPNSDEGNGNAEQKRSTHS